ncbi:hypothetical protein D3C78_981380 [compost metagenome]
MGDHENEHALVLLDAYPRTLRHEHTEEELMAELTEFAKGQAAENGADEAALEEMVAHAAAYAGYVNSLEQTERIGADIHLLQSSDNRDRKEAWAALTSRSYTELQAAGTHLELLQEPFLSANLPLLEQILGKAVAQRQPLLDRG